MIFTTDTKLVHLWISQGEHVQQDFKFEISNAKKIAKSLSDFANTQGGRLLIGVKDNGRIAGIQSEEELYMIQSAAEFFSSPKVEYEAQVFEMEDGKNILCIDVPKAQITPVYAKDEEGKEWAYIRIKDENVLADSIQLQLLKNRTKPEGEFISYTQEEQLVLHTLKENQGLTINQLAKITELKRNRIIRLLIKFSVFDLVCADYRNSKFVYLLKTTE